MVNCLSKCRQSFTAVLATFVIFNPVWAEDIEIFFSQASNQDAQPNVLFILDGSGSMGEYDGGSKTRLERLRTSLTSVLENTSNINAGLMRFSHSQSGGSIIYPIRPIDQQLCNGQPCDDDTVFSAQSRVASSSDDATEAANGAVSVTDQQLTLMRIPGIPTGASWVGVRFPDLQIPQGATITDARVAFTSTGDYDEYTNLTIYAENSDDAQPYTDSFNSISSRTRTNTNVTWNNIPKWYDDNTFESPNLSTLVQQIVNKTDWCGGNAMGLVLAGSGARLASSHDNGSADGPVLKVEYKLKDISATGGCSTTTVISKVSQGKDDAMQRETSNSWRNGLMYRDYSDLIIRKHPTYSNGYETGILFRDVAVPKDAEIVEANLIATIGKSRFNSGSLSVKMALEKSGNASAIGTNRFNISNRSTVSPSVTWSDVSSVSGSNVLSPSLTDMAQEIVNRADWEEDNDMMLMLEPGNGGGQRSFKSYNNSQANSPALKITFKSQIRTAADQIDGPVTDVRSEIIQALNDMLPEGGTPTVGALLEGRRYFEGENVKYGKFRYYNSAYTGSPYYWGRYGRISHRESYTGGSVLKDNRCLSNALNGRYCATERISGTAKYISPIEDECQANHIVILTDGEPTVDSGAITEVKALTGGSCDPQKHDEGTCGEELADYLKESDNKIMTHTIGFNFTTQWLKDVASAGGGGYYTADTASQLSNALTSIINGVQDVNTTFVAPGVTVDRFSKLTHRNDLYLALFQPKSSPRWTGNMKRYQLNGNPLTLYDANNKRAMDSNGDFKETAKSYWSDSADGNDVGKGGAAHELTNHSTRNIYTNISGNDLTSTANAFTKSNSALTYSHLGLAASESGKRDLLIDWSRGVDVDDEDGDDQYDDTRPHIGDPLHSQPQIVTYDGPSTSPVSVVFMATNDGFLHAIDSENGNEVFSFIPKELLPGLQTLYDNNPAVKKPYGLDGPMSVWTQDNNNNGIIEGGDHLYLYTGMRRGGRSYYALDVSNRTNPELIFQIKGGTAEFSELGQTWSKPVVTRIKYNGSSRQVLIIAGGYDDNQDDNSYRTTDSVGRAIYIVDAATGEKLWSGGHADAQPNKTFPKMKYSVPSAVSTIDSDGDGHVDQFYTGDMGGQVWRFDIDPESNSANNMITGGVIAQLAEDGSASSNRRFYHAPDISYTLKDGKRVLNIGIGSGYQAHPLNKIIDDRFYLIRYPFDLNEEKQYGIFDETASNPTYLPIDESNLFDATDNVLGQGSPADKLLAQTALADSSGWLLRMERGGEKILGSSLTLRNTIMFTSYVPSTLSTGCQPQLGTGIFWAVNLWDATPAQNLDGEGDDDNLSKSDRNSFVPGSGLPAGVQTYFVETTSTDSNGNVTKNLVIATSSGQHIMIEHEPGELTERKFWSELPDF